MAYSISTNTINHSTAIESCVAIYLIPTKPEEVTLLATSDLSSILSRTKTVKLKTLTGSVRLEVSLR